MEYPISIVLITPSGYIIEELSREKLLQYQILDIIFCKETLFYIYIKFELVNGKKNSYISPLYYLMINVIFFRKQSFPKNLTKN